MSDPRGPWNETLDRWEQEQDPERDSRAPATTGITASDREMGFERGMVLAYLDLAVDALVYLKHRTRAGRQWIVSDEALDGELEVLCRWRGEVLRGERAGTRGRGGGR